MAQEKTTERKRNAYKIHSIMSQAIFKYLIVSQVSERFKNTPVEGFDRPMLSSIANVSARAIMMEPRFDVVLRKG